MLKYTAWFASEGLLKLTTAFVLLQMFLVQFVLPVMCLTSGPVISLGVGRNVCTLYAGQRPYVRKHNCIHGHSWMSEVSSVEGSFETQSVGRIIRGTILLFFTSRTQRLFDDFAQQSGNNIS